MVPSNLCDWLLFLLGNMGSLERFPQTNVSGEGKEEYERECVRIFYLNNTFTVLHWKRPAQGGNQNCTSCIGTRSFSLF